MTQTVNKPPTGYRPLPATLLQGLGQNLPAYDKETHDIVVCDLADFPRGEFSNTKEDGRNGPIHFYHAPEDVQALAFNEGGLAWAGIDYFSEHPDREIEIVNLENGLQIITDNDPRAVIGLRPSDLVLRRFTPTDALKSKVVVPCVVQEPVVIDRLGDKDMKERLFSEGKESELGVRALESILSSYDVSELCVWVAGYLKENLNLPSLQLDTPDDLTRCRHIKLLLRVLGIRAMVWFDQVWRLKLCGCTGNALEIIAELTGHKGLRDLEVIPTHSMAPVFEGLEEILTATPYELHTGNMRRADALALVDAVDNYTLEEALIDELLESPTYVEWREWVKGDPNITWLTVDNVQYTHKKETGYDLTVPGHETFVNEEGVVLSNTLNVHVPATPEANKNVLNRLMASKQLFAIRDPEQPINPPKYEMILGLYQAKNSPAKSSHVFETWEDAVEAVRQGRISMSDEVEVLEGQQAKAANTTQPDIIQQPITQGTSSEKTPVISDAGKAVDYALTCNHKSAGGYTAEMGCLMANFPANAAEQFVKWCQRNVPDYNLTGDGREYDIHLTLLYGFPADFDPQRLKEVFNDVGPFSLRLGKVSKFENADACVLKVEVTGERIKNLNKRLRETFPEVTVTYPDYNPHVTLAYVKPGTCDQLVGSQVFRNMTIPIDRLCYSAPSKEKWDLFLESKYLIKAATNEK